ncbi:hypothetical protein P691DRAFT_664328 [Macrolepiota fuliginosa MF-IS2]|uniref:G domain-containing protein n=1 Tax=Macrolepiota fuliginosa MF-IS2 TaxID=1400762 RepID=A0A9P6C3N5_9AGAR|nr:hypothetical protein P691DRAFT_664328 [Macrolepiota fuliginosa MF-IS2]
MGPTGTGKSLLVDLLTTGKIGKRAGTTLKPETTRVTPVRVHGHKQYGGRVVLIDTPSFDNDDRSDLDILDEISRWLETAYRKSVKLTGLLYLHRINDNRMGGSPRKNLRIFGELCGTKSLDRVILVSTMWHMTPREAAERRYQELEANFWKPLIDKGSRCERLEKLDGKEAWRIVEQLIEGNLTKNKEAVQLQGEIVEENKPLIATRAGRELGTELEKKLAQQKDTIIQLRARIDSLAKHDPAQARELKKNLRELEKQVATELETAQHYKVPLGRRILSFFGLGKKSSKVSLTLRPD